MKLALLVVLALVACKSKKPAAPACAGGSATPIASPAPARAPAAAATAAKTPALPAYTAPEAPDGEVVPAQAMPHAAGPPVVHRDPAARMHDQLDANHDGTLTPAEVKKDLGPDVDTDGDGQISKDEIQAALRVKRLRARASSTR